MERALRAYWKTLVFFALTGLVGGFLTGLFLLDSYPPEIRAMLTAELEAEGLGDIPQEAFLATVTALQGAFYGLVLGAAGIFFGKKTGLWKDERTFAKKPLLAAAAVAVLGGLLMIAPDLLFFGRYSQAVMDSYAAKPTPVFILAGVIYGGVTEEVMLRLFWMSLTAFVLHKLFGKGRETPSDRILIGANIVAALLFAAAHLPATLQLLGSSPMIIFRCFLLNGGFGLLFGRLYRKHGLRYAMLAHGGCHIVSKLIWLLFI